MLGADTRSTAGTVVADKNCEKIHPITDKIFCCGAGTAADCEMVTGMVSSTMKLHQYATGRPARVVTVKTLLSQHLFRYQGHVGAALVLGGVDLNGPHLYSVRLSRQSSLMLYYRPSVVPPLPSVLPCAIAERCSCDDRPKSRNLSQHGFVSSTLVAHARRCNDDAMTGLSTARGATCG